MKFTTPARRMLAAGAASALAPGTLVGVGANVADADDNGNGTYSFDVPGFNADFQVPAADAYDVLGPTAFTIVATYASGSTVANVPCTLSGDKGAYSSIVVTKNESTSSATALNSPVRKGRVAEVKTKVTAPNEIPGGRVLLKKGTKTLTKTNLNDKGVVVLKTKALPVGKNRLTTVYKGDGYTKPSRDTVVVTVKR